MKMKVMMCVCLLVACAFVGCGPVFGGGVCPPPNPEPVRVASAYGEKSVHLMDVNGVLHEVVIEIDPEGSLMAMGGARGDAPTMTAVMWGASQLLIPSAHALSCIDADEAHFLARLDIYTLDVETFERKDKVYTRSLSGSYSEWGDFNLWGEVQAYFRESADDEIDMISFKIDQPGVEIDFVSPERSADLGGEESDSDMGGQDSAP